MSKESICVSLELAKQLRDGGYPQECLHYWGGIDRMTIWCSHVIEQMPLEKRFQWIAAPTAAEIGEKLPHQIKTKEGNYWSFNSIKINGWTFSCSYESSDHHKTLCSEVGDTEIEVRAKMYLYLKKEGLL